MSDLQDLSKALGYQIHTNRELGMMLRGEKPLSIFSDWRGCFPDFVLRYLRLFDRHVSAGRFVKREYTKLASDEWWAHMVLYALPAEEWRIDQMIELQLRLPPWTPECERLQGHLLGYSEEQNDIWMARYSA
jgi:hypothetical protein